MHPSPKLELSTNHLAIHQEIVRLDVAQVVHLIDGLHALFDVNITITSRNLAIPHCGPSLKG
jgi:hypothetical protein